MDGRAEAISTTELFREAEAGTKRGPSAWVRFAKCRTQTIGYTAMPGTAVGRGPVVPQVQALQ